jgi:hypothetical protein
VREEDADGLDGDDEEVEAIVLPLQQVEGVLVRLELPHKRRSPLVEGLPALGSVNIFYMFKV